MSVLLNDGSIALSAFVQVSVAATGEHPNRPFTARMRRADGGHDLLQAAAGSTLLDAIKMATAGPGGMGACGGQGACGTCRVAFDPFWFDRLVPATRREKRLLDALPGRGGSHRLACQIRFDANLDGIVFAPAPIT